MFSSSFSFTKLFLRKDLFRKTWVHFLYTISRFKKGTVWKSLSKFQWEMELKRIATSLLLYGCTWRYAGRLTQMQQVCGMAVPQLSAVYLRNYWFWTGGFRVHKGGRVGIQLFCWHSRQIVQNLTLKKKVVVTWNTHANSKLMWSTTVQKIASLFAVFNFFIKPNIRSRW